MHPAMKRHLGNISRQVGHDVSNRYSYILSSDDLTNAYLQMRDELGYPLMMDSKYRRAIVYNKKGLEKKLEKMIIECIYENMQQLVDMIAEDTVNEITSQLNTLVQNSNGVITVGKSHSYNTNHKVNKFANMLAKGLVKGVGKLVDEIFKENRDDRR